MRDYKALSVMAQTGMLPASGRHLDILLLLGLLFRLVAVPASIVAVQPELRCGLRLPQLQLVPDRGAQAGLIFACWTLSPDLHMHTAHVMQLAAGTAMDSKLVSCSTKPQLLQAQPCSGAFATPPHLHGQRASSNRLAPAGHQQPVRSCGLSSIGAGVAAVAAWLDRYLAADWPCLELNLDGQRLQQVSPLTPAGMQRKCECP